MAIELPSSLDDIKKYKSLLDFQERIVLEKSMRSHDPEELLKANLYWKDIEKRETSDLKSYLIDPYEIQSSMGYKDKNFALSYQTLRRMAKTPIINAIIGTRVEQVLAFCEPQTSKYSTGFIIQKKKPLFSDNVDTQPTRKERERITYLTNFLLNGGAQENAWHGDTFDTFARKHIIDSLSMDQSTFEVVRDRAGRPVEYLATDGATYRIADSFDDDAYQGPEKEQINGYFPSYVQIHEGRVVAEFYPWELCFGVRNQQTRLTSNGYGCSEIEDLINVVTWMLYGDTYNGKFFSQGSAPKGILKVSGNVNPARLAEFKQAWTAMVAGIGNAHRTPVIESDSMEWIDMQKNNRDMEFQKWQEYLIKLACAIFKIDPAEVGFDSKTGTSAPLFEKDNEAKLKYSKDKGLKPLLKYFQRRINKYIINPLDPNYELVFVGIDTDSELNEVDLDIKKAGSFMTLKEIRKKYKLTPDVPDDDVVLNPTFVQARNAAQQAKMQGGDQSNAYVDYDSPQYQDENSGEDDQQDYGQSQGGFEETEKGEQLNPLVKELNDLLKKEFVK